METIENVTNIGIYPDEFRIMKHNHAVSYPRTYNLIVENIERVTDRSIAGEHRTNISFERLIKGVNCYIYGSVYHHYTPDTIYCGAHPHSRIPEHFF